MCFYWSACASFHIDTTTKDRPLTEVEEPEVEYQQQEPEPSGNLDQDQEYDYTNFESQQGKHRCILTQCRTSVESLII